MIRDMKIDGDRLREARERAFLSQGELAEGAGLSRFTIWRIEDGGSPTEVYPRTIRKLAKALGVGPQELVPDE